MEEINQSFSKDFSAVKLYLDDLGQIIEILKKEGFKEISITTPTHKYAENELGKITRGSYIEEIIAHDPFHISIKFTEKYGKGGRIYSGTDTAKAIGLIQKLGSLLLTRKRLFFSFISSNFFIFPLIFAIEALALLLEAFHKIDRTQMLIIILLDLVILFPLIFLSAGYLFKKNYFFYKKREDQPTFWVRKKDDIIAGSLIAIPSAIVGAIIGAILGAIITAKYLQK
jgi:hypothetical protein